MEQRKITIVTSTRADWGLLRPLAAALRSRNDVVLSIIATNMHLDPTYGYTVSEIEADGFRVDARVPMTTEAVAKAFGDEADVNFASDDTAAAGSAPDSAMHTVEATAVGMAGVARAFARLRPDMVIILGDRYEMLAVATAATIMRLPIVHIAGGEISEGAFDDSIRHAITKLSALHLTATEQYRQRVISMGEDPSRVVNTGAIGVYNLLKETPMSKAELEESIGLPIDRRTLLVTLHPAIMDDAPASRRILALTQALDVFPDSRVIFTYPNNDPDGRIIIREIEAYVARNPHRCVAIPSLGWKRYLSALRYVGAVVGNSSSGIVEVPSTGIPTVDIGKRQRGRMASESVIHCGPDATSIIPAIREALSGQGQQRARRAENPYAKPDTLQIMVEAIMASDPATLRSKRFIDHF